MAKHTPFGGRNIPKEPLRSPEKKKWLTQEQSADRVESVTVKPKPPHRHQHTAHGDYGGFLPVVPPSAPPILGAPTDILIEPQLIAEKTPGAVIGVVTVVDPDLPNDAHVFSLSDSRFEIVGGIIQLVSGQQVVFATEPSVAVTVTATDLEGHVFSKSFTFLVTELVIPETNHAPTNVLLDNTTISDTELGAVVGTVTAVDEDLPNDTIVLTVDDDRFVIIGDQLRLKPNRFVSHLLEPIITLPITATDAGGESVTRLWEITVTDIPVPDLANAYFVGPASAGAANGSSFANRYGISSLNTVIGLARTNSKQILLASDLGNYAGNRITLTQGGVAGTPVIVRGVNATGEEDAAPFVGGRAHDADGQWTLGGAQGSDVFKFAAGADHLVFRNIDFTHCGNGCFSFTAPVSDITIDTVVAQNVRRFIENAFATPATTATLTALRVRNVLIEGFSKQGARLQYNTNNCAFENCVADSLGQDGDNFAEGWACEGTTHDVTFTDVVGRNSHDIIANQNPQSFYNGDGFTSEKDTYNLTYLRCTATGNTDAGFDMKGVVTMTDCLSAQNKENYKWWGTYTVLRCHGADPRRDVTDVNRVSQIEINKTTPVHIGTLTDCTFVDNDGTTEFINVATTGNKSITLVNCSVQKHASTSYTHGATAADTITLGVVTPTAATIIPVISDVFLAGETFTVTPGTVPGSVSTAFQWMSNGVYIDDEVGADYTTTTDDIGLKISCRQFDTDASGYVTESTSLESATIAASSLANLTEPVVIGPLGVNGILSVSPGTYSGVPQPTLTYPQWEVGGVLVAGTTATTYTIKTADIGKTIRVPEIATNTTGSITTYSALVGPVVASLSAGYIRRSGHGAQDGSDWDNALGLLSINSLLAALGPDGVVYLPAWESNLAYSGQLTLTHGGTAGHPIVIRGVLEDLTPALATMTGVRTSWTKPGIGTLTDPFTTINASATVTVDHVAHGRIVGERIHFPLGSTAVGGLTIIGAYTVQTTATDSYTILHDAVATSTAGPGGGTVDYDYETPTNVASWGQAGQAGFVLQAGANHLTFSYINFTRFSDTIYCRSDLTGLTVEDCTFYNVRRFFEMDLGRTLTNVLIQRVTGTGHSKTLIRFRGNSHDWQILNCEFDAAYQYGDNFAVGVEANETAHGLYCYRVHPKNGRDQPGSTSYWNGDGFGAENGNYDLTYEECNPSGWTDAGFDLKCADGASINIINCNPTDNCANFKLWGVGASADGRSANHLVSGGTSKRPYARGGTNPTSHFQLTRNADVLVTGLTISGSGQIYKGTDNTQGLNGNSACIVRECSDVDRTAATGTVNVMTTGSVLLTGVDSADVTPPAFTSDTTPDAPEELPLHYTPTSSSTPVTWDIVGGADADLFYWNGVTPYDRTLLSALSQQFETPADANLDNVYEVQLRCRDAARNATLQTISVTVTDTVEATIDTDARAYLDTFASVPADGAQISIDVSNLVKALKFYDLWDKIAYCGLAVPDVNGRKRDLRNPSRAFTEVGSLTFTDDRGWVSNGSTGHLSIGTFAAIDAALNRTNIGIMVWSRSDIASSGGYDFGMSNSNSASCQGRTTNDTIVVRANSGPAETGKPVTDSKGWYGWQRTSGTTGRVWKNGVIQGGNLAQSSLNPLVGGTLNICRSNATNYSLRQIFAFMVLKSEAVSHPNLYTNCMLPYALARGAAD